MRRALIAGLIVIVVGIAVWGIFSKKKEVIVPQQPVAVVSSPVYKAIGKSVQGRNIESYTYGTGTTRVLFAGGMHGGYEWNSVLLAYQFMEYIKSNPSIVPSNIAVTIIPALNPDAVFAVTGKEGRFVASDVSTNKATLEAARFNAHKVDLNRNFDCRWKPKSTWQSKTVSAGTKAFSEPESAALRDFVNMNSINAAIFWHSQANSVYASECGKGVLPQTLDIMNAYAKASGYTPVKTFDAYAVTGDSEGWLASIGIPAITVELKTHESIEWEKNLAGFKAVLEYYETKK